MKLLLSFCFCCAVLFGRAQGSTATNGDEVVLHYTSVNGAPFLAQTTEILEGSPFFTIAWLKGTAIFTNDARSTPFVGRLNLLSGKLHYLNEAKQEFVAAPNLKEVFLTDTLTGARYRFMLPPNAKENRDIKAKWWQVLASDSVLTLYKAVALSVQESQGYSTATKKRIATSDYYLVGKGERIVPISKIKELAAAFPEYEKAINDFITAQPFPKRSSLEYQLLTMVNHITTLRKQ